MTSESLSQERHESKTVAATDLLDQLQLAEQKNEELQTRLVALEERFNYILKATQEAVWERDLSIGTEWYSDAVQTLFGYDASQINNGSKFWEANIHEEDRHRVIDAIHAAINSGEKNWSDRYRFRKIDGSYAWVLDRGYIIHSSEGSPVRMVGSMQDVTVEVESNAFILEKKVLERTAELKELNERLKKSNSELEQYAYVTSHDLKEPIRKIQTYNSLLKTKFSDKLAPEAIDYLSKVDNATTRMSGLVQDLLKYSRISNYFQSVEDVNLNNTIQNLCVEFDYLLTEKNITIETTELPTVPAIPLQMHQLFFNLVSNSIKFSKEGVPNRITISRSVLSDADKIRMGTLAVKGEYHKLVFKDQGIGFASENNEKIFGMFQRLNDRNKYEGHGIGLAFCRKIVNNHQGMIWADGDENGGASFTIILPASQFLK